MANRTDDLQSSQVEAANLWEVTNDLQTWLRKSVVELARLSKSEVKWSIASEEAKKSDKQKQGGPCYQDPGSPISIDIPDTHVVTAFPFGVRVQAKFQTTWYNGTIQDSRSKGHLVLFDGYESHGASTIVLHLIQTLVPTDTASTSSNTEHTTSPQITVDITP